MSARLNVKMKALSPVGTVPVLLPKQIALNFIVRMATSKIVLMKIAAQNLGLVTALLIVPIKPMDAISPAMIVMEVIVLILIVLHVKMMVK
jgi:hypothetical protein